MKTIVSLSRSALYSLALLTLLFFVATNSFAATFNPATVEQLIMDIQTANSNGEADDINLVPLMVYTITGMETGVPFIGNGNNGLPIIINEGMGNGITINGNGATIERDPSLFTTDPCDGPVATEFRILQINPGARLILNNVDIENGCVQGTGSEGYGGGIFNGGILTITDSRIFDNEARAEGGGIYNDGVLTITDSRIFDNEATDGGGVFNRGRLTITDSRISDNDAIFDGGGVFNWRTLRTLTITNSRISGNDAGFDGGGIYNEDNLIITNSTISDNMADGGGGIYNDSREATITNSTISDNMADDGGGIYNDSGISEIKNTLVVNNISLSSGENCFNSGGVITDNGGNLSDDSTDACSFAFNPIWNTATMLGPLQNNGGDTDTHALIATPGPANPAIDAIVPANCTDQQMVPVDITNDQRNFPRPFNFNCDIGAFELQVATTGILTIEKITLPAGGTNFEFLGTNFPNGCSLMDTFFLDDTETLSCALLPGTYAVEEVNVPVDTTVEIMCDQSVSITDNELMITLNVGDNATCTFTNAQQLTLTIILDPAGTGTGTVTSGDSGIDCGTDCEEDFDFNTMVNLTATPDAGSFFDSWSGSAGCTGTDPNLTITMDEAKTCTATFNFDPVTITANKTGNGDGTITSSPAGISCAPGCVTGNSLFDFGSMVMLTATPDGDSVFVAWTGTGDCASGTPTTTVAADAAKTCTAEFVLKQFELSITLSGSGGGTVTSNPGSISCGTGCMEDFDVNTMVELTATPNGDSEFVQWSDGCSGTDPVTTETILTATTCNAEFALQQRTLTVTKSGAGDGTVTSAPAGIDCGTTCNADFNINSMVTLTATPDGDFGFTLWTGACAAAGTNPMATVTMDAAKSCDAEFTLQQFSVTVNFAGSGAGTVTSAPVGITCPGDCSETYDIHTAITLTPVPDPVSIFIGWSPNCAGGVIADLTADTVCTATFDFVPLLLSPISPGLKNNVNSMTSSNSTPGGRVAFVWGFSPGSFIVGGSICNGIELGIRPLQLLGIVNANGSGDANLVFFVPALGNTALAFTQAVDIPTCRTSEVIQNILRSN